MKELSNILVNLCEDHEVFVTLDSGNCYGLSNFDVVDESIYDRSDLLIADVISKKRTELNNVISVGNKLEFSMNEVSKVEDSVDGATLYQKSIA